MDDLEIGKLYFLTGKKHEHVFFYLYDETRTRVIGELLPFKPFVVIDYQDYSRWRYLIKILTDDGTLGWFVATKHYTDLIKPSKELNDYENSIIR